MLPTPTKLASTIPFPKLKLFSLIALFTLSIAQSEQASAYYSPSTGRFTSRDPIHYPDGPNTYSGWFAPLTTDPFGLESRFKPVPPGRRVEFKGCPCDPKDKSKTSTMIVDSVDDACDCITKAYELLQNNPRIVKDYYSFYTVGDKAVLNDFDNIYTFRRQLKPAYDACTGRNYAALKFQCVKCWEEKTAAYVPWDDWNDKPKGDTIFLCQNFYNQALADPTIIMHELGRLYPGLGGSDPIKTDWKSVYRWDNLLRSLCDGYSEIVSGRRPEM